MKVLTTLLLILGLAGISSIVAQTTCSKPVGTSTTVIKDVSALSKWTVVANATQYQIRYSLTTTTVWTNLTINTPTSDSKLLTGLTQLTEYKWQIRAKCGAVWSAYSDENTFKTKGKYFRDLDADGFGNAAVSVLADTPPTGYVLNSLDCNDADANISPVKSEICNNVDDNCNGLVDAADPTTPLSIWYADNDADTYGRNDVSVAACFAPASYVANNTDCNDNLASINPGQQEICNNIDDNCDGYVDSDNIPLTLDCPPATICNTQGTCGAVMADYAFYASSPNDCVVPTIIQIPASGTVAPVGPTSVLLISSDAGVFVTCIFTVTVADCEKPVIQCPTGNNSFTTSGCNITTPTYAATASDNCTSVSVVQQPVAGSTSLPVGANIVTLAATDAAGNIKTCTITVTVVNPTPDICNGLDDDCDGLTDEDVLAATCPTPIGLQATGVAATSATLAWQPVSCAQNFTVQRRLLGTTTFTTTTVTANSLSVTGLSPATTYQARVRSTCNVGVVSSFSSLKNFTTTTALGTVVNSGISDEHLLLTPNPTQSITRISLNNCPDGMVSLNITDLFNRTIIRKEAMIVGGQLNESVDVSILPSGIYFVHLYLADKIQTTQLIKN